MKIKKLYLLIGILLFIAFLILYKIVIRIPLGPGYQDYTTHITGEYYIIRTSSNQIQISPQVWGDGIAIVPPKVIKVNNYNSFIIAYRQSIESAYDKSSKIDERNFDYWILDTENNICYESLSKKEYFRKLDSLKIPKETELIEVSQY